MFNNKKIIKEILPPLLNQLPEKSHFLKRTNNSIKKN